VQGVFCEQLGQQGARVSQRGHRPRDAGRLARGGSGGDFDRRGPHGRRGTLSRDVQVAAGFDCCVRAGRTQARVGVVAVEVIVDGSVDGSVPAPAVPTAAPTTCP